MDILEWLSHAENTKPLGLIIFFVTFLGILWFVFGSKKRGQKLESYKDIPFLEEESENKERKQ
jgi:cbb3-type cytochrome oxidase subunit 3